jgi:hypothetical protein
VTHGSRWSETFEQELVARLMALEEVLSAADFDRDQTLAAFDQLGLPGRRQSATSA